MIMAWVSLILLAIWVLYWCFDESPGDDAGDRWLVATGLLLLASFAMMPLWV